MVNIQKKGTTFVTPFKSYEHSYTLATRISILTAWVLLSTKMLSKSCKVVSIVAFVSLTHTESCGVPRTKLFPAPNEIVADSSAALSS